MASATFFKLNTAHFLLQTEGCRPGKGRAGRSVSSPWPESVAGFWRRPLRIIPTYRLPDERSARFSGADGRLPSCTVRAGLCLKSIHSTSPSSASGLVTAVDSTVLVSSSRAPRLEVGPFRLGPLLAKKKKGNKNKKGKWSGGLCMFGLRRRAAH